MKLRSLLAAPLLVLAGLAVVASQTSSPSPARLPDLIPIAAPAPAVPCDADGVTVSYTSTYVPTSSPAAFRVQSATVGALDAVQCAGLGVSVSLQQGTTVLATGGPVPIAGTSVTVAFPAPPQAQLVTEVTVTLEIVIPSQCTGMTFASYIVGDVTNKQNLNGGSGNDYILARANDNGVTAGSGNDCVITIKGKSDLKGDSGNDVLIGGPGPGKNSLEGGAGTDKCYAGTAPQTTFKTCEQTFP